MKVIVTGIIAWILIQGIGSLIFWGIGNLVIFVFHINYTWTFLHGVVAQLIYILIQGLFDRETK